MSTAYDEGYEAATAYRDGGMVDLPDNPYPYGGEEWQEWNYGWNTCLLNDL